MGAIVGVPPRSGVPGVVMRGPRLRRFLAASPAAAVLPEPVAAVVGGVSGIGIAAVEAVGVVDEDAAVVGLGASARWRRLEPMLLAKEPIMNGITAGIPGDNFCHICTGIV